MKRPIKVLKINEAKVHRLNEAFICKIDGETFPNKNDLVQHRVEVHGMGKAPTQPESVVRQGDFLITSPSYYQNRITSIKSQLKSNPNDEQLKAKLRLAQAALRKLTGKAPMQPEANNPVEEDIVDMTGDVDSQIATARERLKIWRAKTQDDRKNRMINYYMKRLRELEAKKNTKKEANNPVEEDIVDMTGDVDSQIATARERLKIWRAKTQDDRKNRMINYYMKRLRELEAKKNTKKEANNPVEEDIVDMTGDVDSQIATARERLKIWRAKTQDDRKNRMINYYMKRLRELEAKKNTKKEAKLPPHVRLSEFRKMVREEAHKILEKAGKKPRYVWKTESGKWAGRDEILGNTRYFDEARKARSYSQNGKIMRERKKK